MSKSRIVHYINQFFANIGGEEKAGYQPGLGEGIVGLGMASNQAFGEEAEIVTAATCGDFYFSENVEAAKKTILDMTSNQKPDAVICEPASNTGRYGVACGIVAPAVEEELNLPVLASMYKENSGADMYKTKVYVTETKNSAAGARNAVVTTAPLVLRLTKGEKLGFSKEGDYMPSGIRVSFFESKKGSQRAVEMLIKKLSGKEFTTGFPVPGLDRVDPNPAVKDMAYAKITLVTSGSIIPRDSPGHIKLSSTSKYDKCDINGIMDLTEAAYETAHGKYDPVYANEDADRVPPVDVLREFEKEGKTGSLHRYSYTAVGNGTPVANSKRFIAEFAQELRNDGVNAVILTLTWGTYIRYDAAMVKEIERAGTPVVHIVAVTPISLIVGADRIVPAIAIPHPLSSPILTTEEEKEIRRHILTKALTILETPITEQTMFE